MAQQPVHLLVADEVERSDPFGAQQLGDTYFSSLAPVGAVRGEGDVGAAEGEPLSRHELRSAREYVIVGFEDELGQVSRGDDQRGDSAELEVDDGAQFLGQVGQGLVRWGLCEEEVVKVAYNWKACRCRWSTDGGFL